MGFMDKAKAQAEKALAKSQELAKEGMAKGQELAKEGAAKGQELAKEGKAKLDEYQAQQKANQPGTGQPAPTTDASGTTTPPADTGGGQSFSLDDV